MAAGSVLPTIGEEDELYALFERVFERVQQEREGVDLSAVAEMGGISVPSFVRKVEDLLHQRSQRTPTASTRSEVATSAASLMTLVVEELARWENALRTCAPSGKDLVQK